MGAPSQPMKDTSLGIFEAVGQASGIECADGQHVVGAEDGIGPIGAAEETNAGGVTAFVVVGNVLNL